MQEENVGITFKGICKTIWLRKWVALIVAVLVGLVMAVSLYYGYNPNKKNYEVEFGLNLPGGENGAFYSYPDGKLFHYADLTSSETLKTLKEEGGFSGVDVDKMTKKGHIEIKRNVEVTETGVALSEVTYSVTVRASYFDGKDQAEEFLTALAKYPVNYLKNMEINYDISLTLAKEATDDSVKLGYLKDQLEFLNKEYEKLIAAYGETFVVDGDGANKGKTLLAYLQESRAYLSKLENAASPLTGLESACDDVEGLLSSFATAEKSVYTKAATVVLVQPSVIVEKGGISLSKTLILSVIVAVVVALVAAYVAGYYKLRALKAAENTAGEGVENSAPEVEENKE